MEDRFFLFHFFVSLFSGSNQLPTVRPGCVACLEMYAVVEVGGGQVKVGIKQKVV